MAGTPRDAGCGARRHGNAAPGLRSFDVLAVGIRRHQCEPRGFPTRLRGRPGAPDEPSPGGTVPAYPDTVSRRVGKPGQFGGRADRYRIGPHPGRDRPVRWQPLLHPVEPDVGGSYLRSAGARPTHRWGGPAHRLRKHVHHRTTDTNRGARRGLRRRHPSRADVGFPGRLRRRATANRRAGVDGPSPR